MSDLSAVLEAGLSLEEVHKFLSEGMSLSEISAAVKRLQARGEAVTEPEEEILGRKTALNIAALEAELERLGISVRFDQIRHEMTVSGVPPQYNPETAAQDLPVLLHDTLKTRYRCTKDLLTDLLGVIAGKHRFNPVLDLLNGSQWDGESRLQALFQILGIGPDDGLSQTLVWKWCCQAVALLENPADKPFGADGVLVLQGPQGCGKTSFVRKLGISPEFTRLGQYFDPKDKDTTRRCVSCWICELGEVETTLRGDLERLKAFLTAETDVYRVPYGRTDCQYIRRTSFIATCNSSAFLIDPTGSRRFWTVPVQQIDLERLQDFDSLQFWLEVRAYVVSGGQSFRLTREEQAQLAQRNAAHEKPLKSQPEIEDIFTLAEQKPEWFSWEYVTVSRLKIENETLKAFSVEQIGKALDKLGIVAERKSIDGYGDLDAYCDTASIMSYGMAWAGSAPGPVSPRSWLEGIYDYATKVMNPDKMFLGMPAYGWNWQIYDTPENLGKTYRGTSNTYYAAKLWMTGGYNFTDDAPPQPFLPIVAYWDDYDKAPYAFPHVYDYMEGADAVSREYPQLVGTYNRRRYLTAYGKEQKTEFGTVYIDHDGGNYSSASGIVSIENGIATLGDNGSVTYSFTVDTAGTYDVAVQLCYPFWDKNGIYVALDGSRKHFTESRLWWPYWRSTFWTSLAGGVTLSAGTHTITISVDVKGVQFYGFRVCSAFSEEPSAGEATFALAPRSFKDVNGNMAVPDKGFKLTLEMLRRKPDSALVWYEDLRDYGVLETDYWTVRSGSWKVWRSDEYSMERVYSQLEGKGELAWNYDGFSELHLRARLAFPSGGSGKAGVFCGSLFCCLNYDTQAVELYNGSTLLGSYSQEITRTSSEDLRGNPTMYTVEMRVRGNRVRVYSGSSYTLRFTATASGFSGGYAGYRSDNTTVCELLRLGDAWTYEPYERFDVEMPDGSFKSYGRISRTNCTWDEEFQVFTLTSDVEETSTRSEDISLDYDFFHSDLLEISCGGNYTAKVIPKDINIWISRLFLGDAEGFSILYYQDVDSLIYWANQAAYRWKLRGMCMWSLGQEDMRLWEYLPKQI